MVDSIIRRVGGHYSYSKTSASQLGHFILPGLHKDVKIYCKACPVAREQGEF